MQEITFPIDLVSLYGIFYHKFYAFILSVSTLTSHGSADDILFSVCVYVDCLLLGGLHVSQTGWFIN